MQGDRGRVWQMERRSIDRGRDSFRGGSAGHFGDGRRLRLAQRHARRQGLDQGIDLHHPGRHGPLLLDDLSAPGRSISTVLHSLENSSGI